jgi:uncharacterized membrane protein YcaP (DUF421 family)
VNGLLRDLFGPDGEPTRITALQMVARAAAVYLWGLAILRLAGPRLLGRFSALDVVVGIVLGSVLSRAVNGTAPLLPTLLASAALLVLHWALAALACRFPPVSRATKGRPVPLILEGRVLEENLRRHSIGRHDLEEALRIAGHRPGAPGVEEAHLERNGRVSVVVRAPVPPVATRRGEPAA